MFKVKIEKLQEVCEEFSMKRVEGILFEHSETDTDLIKTCDIITLDTMEIIVVQKDCVELYKDMTDFWSGPGSVAKRVQCPQQTLGPKDFVIEQKEEDNAG